MRRRTSPTSTTRSRSSPTPTGGLTTWGDNARKWTTALMSEALSRRLRRRDCLGTYGIRQGRVGRHLPSLRSRCPSARRRGCNPAAFGVRSSTLEPFSASPVPCDASPTPSSQASRTHLTNRVRPKSADWRRWEPSEPGQGTELHGCLARPSHIGTLLALIHSPQSGQLGQMSPGGRLATLGGTPENFPNLLAEAVKSVDVVAPRASAVHGALAARKLGGLSHPCS